MVPGFLAVLASDLLIFTDLDQIVLRIRLLSLLKRGMLAKMIGGSLDRSCCTSKVNLFPAPLDNLYTRLTLGFFDSSFI